MSSELFTHEVLETARMLMVKWDPQQLSEFFRTASKETIMKELGHYTDRAYEMQKMKVEGGLTTWRSTVAMFIMLEKSTSTVIGTCALHNWQAMHMRAELGYEMLREEYKGKGYMKEAITTIVHYGFEKMNLNRIEAFIGPLNTPSIKIAEGVGLTREGLLRQHFVKNGIPDDSYVFGILKSEYNKKMSLTLSSYSHRL